VTERELEDVEAETGEMLIDTLSSLAEGLNVDVAFLFRDPNILASWNPIALWLRQLDNLRLAV